MFFLLSNLLILSSIDNIFGHRPHTPACRRRIYEMIKDDLDYKDYLERAVVRLLRVVRAAHLSLWWYLRDAQREQLTQGLHGQSFRCHLRVGHSDRTFGARGPTGRGRRQVSAQLVRLHDLLRLPPR